MDIAKRIISLFIHNDIPEKARRKFIAWMLEGGQEKESALYDEWEKFIGDESLHRLDIKQLESLYRIKSSVRGKGLFLKYGHIAAVLAAVLLAFSVHHILISS